MIISHKHKFIFVKTRKTAGTSIEIALSKICGDKDILTPIRPVDEAFREEYSQYSAQNYRVPFRFYKKKDYLNLLRKRRLKEYYNHMTCSEIKEYISKEQWNNYYKFTIERNPYDRAVSLYYWRGGDKKYHSVYEFLLKNKRGLEGLDNYHIYSIDNLVAVDKVYTYEDLEFFQENISKRLGLKTRLEIPQYKAKSESRKVMDYKEVLDENAIELIKVLAAREIQLFNYQY